LGLRYPYPAQCIIWLTYIEEEKVFELVKIDSNTNISQIIDVKDIVLLQEDELGMGYNLVYYLTASTYNPFGRINKLVHSLSDVQNNFLFIP
jgi:hypothetical protein